MTTKQSQADLGIKYIDTEIVAPLDDGCTYK